MEVSPGTRLGRYEIRSQLGAGGMGEVYLAQDTKLDRKVALKILPAEVAANQDRMRRFVQEAKAASALNHPNIITIYEIEQIDSVNFIAIEFIDGETLRQRMRKAPLKLSEVLDVAAHITNALAAAHAAGIVHRDIKPENIMLRRDGIVKVLDFGLAKLTERLPPDSVDTEALTSFKTDPGTVVGTVFYMSPEQAKGSLVDARTDVWSLGVVLYEMVAGCLPFEGATTSEMLASILNEKEPPPLARFVRHVPAELERIVEKSLRKDREERYQTAKDLLLDLRRLKHKLEVDAEIERTVPPHLRGATGEVKPSGDQEVVLTAQAGSAQTATVESARTTLGAISTEIKSHKRGVAVILAAIILLSVAGIAYYFYFVRSGSRTAIDSIAVLPLVNISGDPNTEYLSDGITDSLINSLSKLPNLKVMSRNSVFRYKGKETDALEAAHALGVRAVLTGKLIEQADNLSISVELVDALDNSHLWGEQYNRKLSDIVKLQSEISQDVSEKLRLKLTGEEQKTIAKHYTENSEAYQLYLKGRFQWSKFTDDGLKKAIEYYNQAIEKDPTYALAYSGLANVYLVQGAIGLELPKDAGPKGEWAAHRALELDDTLAQAHSALGGLNLLYKWDWDAADRELSRATKLDPKLQDPYTLRCYYLEVHRELDRATTACQKAQQLEPLWALSAGDMASLSYYRGDYDSALVWYQKAAELDANVLGPLFWIGQVYERKGMYAQAIAECEKAIAAHGRDPAILAVLGYVYGVTGKKTEAAKIGQELAGLWSRRYFSPLDIALVYAGLGDKDQAMAWLEKAYDARDGQLIWVGVEPELESLGSDKRFRDMLQRMRLPN